MVHSNGSRGRRDRGVSGINRAPLVDRRGSKNHVGVSLAGGRPGFHDWVDLRPLLRVCDPIDTMPALRRRSREMENRRRFVAVWIVPGFFFFAFVFLNYVNQRLPAGPVVPPICSTGSLLLTSPDPTSIASWAESPSRPESQLTRRFGSRQLLLHPSKCPGVRARDDLHRAGLPHDSESRETLIIGFDSHFLGYRHADIICRTCDCPDPEVGYSNGNRVFHHDHHDMLGCPRVFH